jgi:hypothetical protein
MQTDVVENTGDLVAIKPDRITPLDLTLWRKWRRRNRDAEVTETLDYAAALETKTPE